MGGTSHSPRSKSAQVPSLGTEVAHQVGRNIVTGRYLPGSLIEDETSLARSYGVSRTVVRDAVKVLVGKGLLEVRRGIGTRVRPREEWALLDVDVLTWQLSVPADAALLLQLLEVRQLFEPQAAAWAAQRATVPEVADIGEAVDSMSAHVADAEIFLNADASFHRSVLRAAHNEFLLALSGMISSLFLPSIRITNQDVDSNRRAVPFHRAVFDAIQRSDDVDAQLKMKLLMEDAGLRIKALRQASA